MLLLHISDIHFRSPDCLNPDLDPDRPYRTRLIQDVRERVAELGSAGAILIGGDIAFKGAPEEYTTAMTWIKELAAVAGCPPERIFVIPGNHDVDRSLILRTAAVRNAQAAISKADPQWREREFRTQISDPDTARSLVTPISAYNDFAKVFNCQVYLPDHLYWKQDLELEDGVTLRVFGLTSTILSGERGLNDTRESLYLSPLQTVLDPVDDVVNLAFCHHPPDWLMDQDDVNDAICGRSSIHMFGHKHRQRITREDGYVRFSAGAVNPDRNEPGWMPGYNLVRISISGVGTERRIVVEAHLRQWQSNPDRFRAVSTAQNETVFSHTIRFPGDARAKARFAEPLVSVSSPANPLVTADANLNEVDAEAAMGDPSTRNLIFRFWSLTASARREITLKLGLITKDELTVPEPERYGRALIRAGERDQVSELGAEVAKRERT
ncbi:metallophosphoesterase [Rhizobium sp. PP-CC-3G-465]|uniref:metallophosphoesterase n=1 Tax=Rhizobium sp. PP-CC-3G-465 TaxID=2135648 RepID=UPI001051315D|nr:calcineurin-like phosphoesterase family protein [Rhizobium sp. PP-CC-3G-465]